MGEVCYAFVMLTDLIVFHEAAFMANYGGVTLDYGYSGNYLSGSSLSGSRTFTPYSIASNINSSCFSMA